MKEYYTGLIPYLKKENKENYFRGRGFNIKIDKCFERKNLDNESKEIIICAKNRMTANKCLKLILAAIVLLDGERLPFEPDLMLFEKEDIININTKVHNIDTGSYLNTLLIPEACSLALKASNKSIWIYALTKYYFSIKNYSIPIMDLQPHRSRNFPVNNDPFEIITMVYSILSAYSVIEELGLEIRASNKNPSKINGIWNPIIKNDLEERLIKSNINITEPITWLIRGPKRNLDRKRSIDIKQKAEWAGYDVNDADANIVDAISYADWLRDKIVAHKVRPGLTNVLKPYDVLNIQFLARRLILETLGYWEAV